MNAKKKDTTKRKALVLAAATAIALLVFSGSIAPAAQASDSSAQEAVTWTMVDPFGIRIITLSTAVDVTLRDAVRVPERPPSGVMAVTLPDAVDITPRNPVRIPVRPPLRSEFRPTWW